MTVPNTPFRPPPGKTVRLASMLASAALLLMTASPSFAQTADTLNLPALGAADPQPAGTASPAPLGSGLRPPGKYLLPALEIVGFDTLLNRFDNAFVGPDWRVSSESIRRNLHSGWVEDSDPFRVNELGHPYQGSVYHTIARSTGLGYWESTLYTFAGSAAWEIAGEVTRPSRNDQVASGIAGSFLGEALYRMSHLMLERGTFLSPGWRETAAAAISPANGFNRLVFDKRLDAAFSSHDPAIFSRFRAGLIGTLQNRPGPTTSVERNLAAIDYSLDYGLPGKGGYDYARPFDYFSFEVTGTSASGVETLTDRGLLIGTDYALGDDYRGIWGLYGSYDYLSPQLFRLASTALSLGTTAQWNLTPGLALQGTGLVGVGYSATGVVHSGPNPDFNYGLAPQALLSLRLIGGNRFAFDVAAREYFVSRIGAPDRDGHDNIVRGDASLTVRLHGHHAIAVKYVLTRRDASSSATGDVTQQRGTIGIYYTWINDEGFGAVGW